MTLLRRNSSSRLTLTTTTCSKNPRHLRFFFPPSVPVVLSSRWFLLDPLLCLKRLHHRPRLYGQQVSLMCDFKSHKSKPFAASKEWVIPAKPKPGRKPKKETSAAPSSPVVKDDEASTIHILLRFSVDVESRTRSPRVGVSKTGDAVNSFCVLPSTYFFCRAAQRAFRERKQSQLAELQARLQSYEQGEIERNIALQNIAKKMKDENEELRKENQLLKEKIARLEWEAESTADGERKRNRDDPAVVSPNMSPGRLIRNSNKRAKMSAEATDSRRGLHFASYAPSPASSLDEGTSHSSSPSVHDNHSTVFPTPPPSLTSMLNYPSSNDAVPAMDAQGPEDSFQCVLCSPDVPCVCREMVMQQAAADTDLSCMSLKLEHDHPAIVPAMNQTVQLGASTSSQINILDNLPAYQAPVPIRRRTAGQSVNPVFPVTPISALSSPPKCSGDPSNCMACADDDFGKAFCQAIGHSVNSTSPCFDCPILTNQSDKIVVGGCCGDIAKCGSCGIAPVISSANLPHTEASMPTDDAWRQLKSHPNVSFADLSLLAEVVARRSKCTGSRVVISPAPGSVTPERTAPGPSQQQESTPDHQSVLLTDPHEHYHQKRRQRSPPPRLVPQEVLIECGRRRMREVNADGVREALRLLDSKFAHAR